MYIIQFDGVVINLRHCQDRLQDKNNKNQDLLRKFAE